MGNFQPQVLFIFENKNFQQKHFPTQESLDEGQLPPPFATTPLTACIPTSLALLHVRFNPRFVFLAVNYGVVSLVRGYIIATI